jgi:hypothetical protein
VPATPTATSAPPAPTATPTPTPLTETQPLVGQPTVTSGRVQVPAQLPPTGAGGALPPLAPAAGLATAGLALLALGLTRRRR